jgi:hypothetical protein
MRAKRFGQLTALGCALALAGAGCGGDDGTGGTTETSTGEAGTAWAPGKDTVIARVNTGGGFVPMEVGFSGVSQVVVFGDGRVLMTEQSEGMPNAFVPRTVRTLDDAGLQMVLDQAADAQLLQTPPEYGQPGVTDLPSTAVRLATADDTYTHSAYALGFEDPGLPAAQTAARARLDGFVKWLEDIDESAAGAVSKPEDWQSPSLAVLAVPAQGTVEGPAPKPWPVAGVDLSQADQCLPVEGADAAAVAEALSDVPTGTRWTSGDGDYSVTARPVDLPDEGCKP